MCIVCMCGIYWNLNESVCISSHQTLHPLLCPHDHMSVQSVTLSLILTPAYCMCPCCRVAGTLKYAHTQSSLSMLEKITRCVQMSEPALLVGETGVGKTAAISYLAKATGMAQCSNLYV